MSKYKFKCIHTVKIIFGVSSFFVMETSNDNTIFPLLCNSSYSEET